MERGLRVVSFEVLPLWTESMGNSTAHLSCPNLILWPACQAGGQRSFQRDNLAMGQSPYNLSLSERTERWWGEWGEWCGGGGAERWRCRKRSTDSESEREEEERGMTNYRLSTFHMHLLRKEEHCLLTYYPSMHDLSGCACQRKWWEVSDSMQIGQAGRRMKGGRWKQTSSWDVSLSLEGHTKVSSGLICGYSLCCSYFCYSERKWWCGGLFGLLFYFEFFLPLWAPSA